MRIKALNGFGLGNGDHAVAGEVYEVSDHFAAQLIHRGWAQRDPGVIVDELPPPPVITTRDPEPVNRDPKPGKGGRR